LHVFRTNPSEILSHVTGWLIFLSLPVLFIAGQHGYERSIDAVFSSSYLILFSSYLFIFYLHTYYLFPKLYLRERYFYYFAILVVLLVLVYFLKPFDNFFSGFNGPDHDRGPGPGFGRGPSTEFERAPFEKMPRRGRRNPMKFDIISIFLFFLTIALSIAIETTRRWRFTEQRILKAETEKANAELSFLKAQINPHFLFNTLNNIYSLAVNNQQNTAPSILKLSNILRYVTDEIAEDEVDLQDEIDCMRDYLDLQALRLGEKTSLHFAINGEIRGRKIAPLILMTFIENAFKYGISNHEKTEININLEVNRETIHFTCVNRIFAQSMNAGRTGIGISNTTQRLEHLYPGKHELRINSHKGIFTVDLIIRK
jgi:two-component system LytT family sensor kinase